MSTPSGLGPFGDGGGGGGGGGGESGMLNWVWLNICKFGTWTFFLINWLL